MTNAQVVSISLNPASSLSAVMFPATFNVQSHLRSRPSEALPSSRQSSCIPLLMSTHASEPWVGDVTVKDARSVGSVTVRVAVRFRPE